ncbi:MAG: FtsK/SpoIIIE domain-containing protein [Acidimicrobiia bacterium]
MTAELTTLAVPIGVRADGRPFVIPLAEYSCLIAGLPGAGKSGGLRSILVAASHRPDVAIVGLDAKRVELRPWEPRMTALAVDLDDITLTLRALVDEMEHRYLWCESQGLDRWPIAPARPQIVVVVDELAELVAADEPGEKERAVLIRRLISKGRAGGITVIAATQRPSADVIPTSIRDLISLRIALATANRESTEMILGGAWREGPAHELPVGPGHQGLCYAVLEGERTPTKARVWHVDNDLIRSTVTRTAHLRPDLALSGMGSAKAPSDGRVKAGEAAPSGLGLDADGAGAIIPPAGQDEATVIAALATAGRPLRFGELHSASGLPEGRCRAAVRGLVTLSRVLQVNGAYRMVS